MKTLRGACFLQSTVLTLESGALGSLCSVTDSVRVCVWAWRTVCNHSLHHKGEGRLQGVNTSLPYVGACSDSIPTAALDVILDEVQADRHGVCPALTRASWYRRPPQTHNLTELAAPRSSHCTQLSTRAAGRTAGRLPGWGPAGGSSSPSLSLALRPAAGAPAASSLSDCPGECGGRKPVRHMEILSPGHMKCKGRLCHSTRATGHSFS